MIEPKSFQRTHTPFFLVGGSEQALENSAKHSSIHLFWSDRPGGIHAKIADLKQRARRYGRQEAIRFGMRLQIICSATEEEAWEDAERLIAGVYGMMLANMRKNKNAIEGIQRASEAHGQVWQLLDESGGSMKLGPHLWTGNSKVRAGARIAVAGNPAQIASTLEEFVHAGCKSFYLSGYPNAKAARIFSETVLPFFEGRNSHVHPQAA
jgi:alkanesulfonate monooxygenase